ncbi:MAG: hypothetical protein A3F13_01570 [Gammaproteobacteria bacterium RIFCSPHIGHO2_12_FULL_40_19]|nr:MAG: hypothetical protein A3F13_01570 [Gammaproteobacteria bacterium RIFCSPHIGHO2_12_FULL_40_19]
MNFFFVSAGLLLILSLLFTYLIRIVSLKKNIVDIPNHRSSHQVSTPRGGGLAFVFLFYAALFLLFQQRFIQHPILLSLLGGIPIACVGYCDDLFGVKAKWRGLIHMLSAIWALAWLGGVPLITIGAVSFHAPILFFMVATFITVWFVNLYNFMDGIDGLAGMEAVFVSSIAGCILLYGGVYSIAFICLALSVAVAGFLVFNWPPAKIFMGDVGSGFLGFIFADLMWITHHQHQLPFSMWIILLSVFIVDASCTLIYRIIQKKKWHLAHREHAYQRLIQAGFSHKKITLTVLGINFLICFPAATIYLHLNSNVVYAFLLLILSAIWLAWFFIIRKHQAV